MKKKHQICTNCVMDTTDSNISFDINGVCDHCNTYYRDIEPIWNYGLGRENELEQMVYQIKKTGEGKEYDCLMGMSGGIDSSYLLYKMVQDYGLRPLVFHVDGGWNTKLAEDNIRKIVDKLGLQMHVEVIDWETMKDLQLAYFKSGVSNIDTPQDHAFFATMYKFASKYNIKHILTGGNYSTECVRNPKEWMYYQSDDIQLRDIHKKFGQGNLKRFPITNILWHKVWLPYVKGIKLIRPLDYFHYNKEEAVKELEDKFGFINYPQKHFESLFTKFYESYWLPTKFGYDTRKVQFSSLILTKQMTRGKALQLLEQPAYNPDTIEFEKQQIADKLGVSIEEFDNYMHIPNKTYKDYKSQESLYYFGAKVMRLFGKERGGKR